MRPGCVLDRRSPLYSESSYNGDCVQLGLSTLRSFRSNIAIPAVVDVFPPRYTNRFVIRYSLLSYSVNYLFEYSLCMLPSYWNNQTHFLSSWSLRTLLTFHVPEQSPCPLVHINVCECGVEDTDLYSAMACDIQHCNHSTNSLAMDVCPVG